MIVVGTTLAAYVMDQEDTWAAWLRNAAAISESHPEGVTYFVAIEVDGRGIEPFRPLLDRMRLLDVQAGVRSEHWTYMLDDGRTAVSTGNRLRHITTGQNLVTDYAVSCGASHLLFLAADLEPPADALPKLLALDHPYVGGEVTTYCLSGPNVSGWPFPVQAHMPTAAFVLLRRDLFNRLRWRWDGELSDDPALYADARDLHGVEALVRKDCEGRHWPLAVPAIEDRGHDMTVVRPLG
jgi:hypothetical protein